MKQASMTEHAADPSVVHVGIDVGSTTTKAVALDPRDGTVLYSSYRRHGARQAESVSRQLDDLLRRFPYSRMRGALCGSGARPIAEALGLPYIQEVVANALALQRLYPTARTAIELGGQDAKVIFFRPDEATGAPTVADMRMNGTCAGGTGALVDEIATLLRVPVEGFNALAERATALYDISGRCGVYAKTDIQPLLNQGVPKEDIAWSLFHAIAKQTIGGLAQGADIVAPVVFEGGPLTFNPRLVDAFAERLGLREEDILRPEHPETIMAYGTALSLSGMFPTRRRSWTRTTRKGSWATCTRPPRQKATGRSSPTTPSAPPSKSATACPRPHRAASCRRCCRCTWASTQGRPPRSSP